MKKLSLIALASLLLVLGACSKKQPDAPAADAAAAAADAAAPAADAAAPAAADAAKAAQTPQEMADAVEFTEEGLMKLFKTEGEVTPDEFEALMLSFAKCDISEREDANETYLSYKCPASKVYDKIASYNSDWKLDDAAKQKTLMKLLKHENPIVREKAYDRIDFSSKNSAVVDMMVGDGIISADDDVLGAVVAIAKEEKDPAVFINIYRSVLRLDSLKSNPTLLAFVNEYAKSDNAAIRYVFADSLIGSRVKGHAESSQTILDLCKNDPDERVKMKACGKILEFEIADSMKIAADILKDPAMAGAHRNIIKTLQERWYSYPSYENFDADAYKLWLDYYKNKNRSEDVPASMSLFSINEDKFDAFKKGAKYFKEAEFADVMAALAEDAKASYMTRNDAIEAIGKLVSKANGDKKLKALDAKLAKRTRDDDRDVELLRSKIADVLADTKRK